MQTFFSTRACATVLCLAAAALATSLPAGAEWVPPYKGNDTGGIIAYPLARTINVRETATAHCAAYGKVPKLLAVQARYGGYISFACLWPRPYPRPTASRVAY
jgi:hypothetical protein